MAGGQVMGRMMALITMLGIKIVIIEVETFLWVPLGRNNQVGNQMPPMVQERFRP